MDRNRPMMARMNRQIRTGSCSGSSQLVVHAVYIQTHHTAMNNIDTRMRFSNVSSAKSVCESCVTANTKTRSKNSSTMPTRPLPALVRSRNNAVTGCPPGNGGDSTSGPRKQVQRCVLQQHDRLRVADLTRGDSAERVVERQLHHFDVLLLDSAAFVHALRARILGHEEVQDLRDGSGRHVGLHHLA